MSWPFECTEYMLPGPVGGVGNRSRWVRRVERCGSLRQVVLHRGDVCLKRSANGACIYHNLGKEEELERNERDL